MFATLIAVAALWGAATGLLVPRAAYRLSVEPEEPWRDSCEAGHALAGPARGWLGTPGCPSCTGPGHHPRTSDDSHLFGPGLVPTLLTALACAALAAATGPRPELAVWLLWAPFAVLLATVDVRVRRLPDLLTLPLAAALPLLLLGAELLPYDAGSWLNALLGGLALGGGYFVLFLIRPGGMGFGDVKLALSLGAALGWYGWGVLFAGTFAGFLFGALYGLGLVLVRRGSRKSAIPFGPFMIGGAVLGLLLGALSATP
ncbi:A24 family peptidase [Streptomyces sp. P9(2023)]|uniref:A24 family peptidase n=1 Tax=Streptomyces sp. P9(2023) TaxID=3064394 RepID=UPI0028F45C48|nr:A24 family peptidase [Streptomyces sp. P9(2023)]MDT9688466.1 A24 family peptidase [Streptomyces sp. P9(2023)]